MNNSLDERMKTLAQKTLDEKISIWELLARLDAENDKLRAAVEWYANPNNWSLDSPAHGINPHYYDPVNDRYITSVHHFDRGEVARQALAQEKEE